MEMYEDFALVYDRFMDETPYEEWCQFVVGRLKQDQITDGILLDLGCGTGSMTELLAKQGYDMIGVDLSDSMLDIAMEKRAQSGHNILYLQQDMREFELYGTVRAVICLCDSLNYLLEEDDLLTTFILTRMGFLSSILIRSINTKQSSVTARLRKTGRIAALSGKIIIRRRIRSTNTI